MSGAITPKPFAVGVNRFHHCLLSTKESYMQIFIKIKKNGRVSSICRFVVECPIDTTPMYPALLNLKLSAKAVGDLGTRVTSDDL